MLKAELVVDCRNTLGESVFWHPERASVFWTDIDGARLWRFDPESGEAESWPTPERFGSVAMRGSGGLVVAAASGLCFYDLDSGDVTPIAEVEADLSSTRLNDGRCDRQGRFVFGGYDEVDRKAVSAVYRLDTDLTVHRLIPGVAVANSICFSPDGGTMYFADTPTRRIMAYDYDTAAGTVGDWRVFCSLEDQPGSPDGSVVDAEGYLWNAQVHGHRVVRYAPDGTVDRIIEVPVKSPTCVGFGGADLDTLYITTLRRLRTAEELAAEPTLGGLFAVKPGVRGLPEPKFRG